MSLRVSMRRSLSLSAAVLAALGAAPAAAQDTQLQCLQAYEAGQVSRREGDLMDAAEKLALCGGPACPVRMQADCQRWHDEVQRSIPTVVFRVRDAEGKVLSNATLSIDGGSPVRLTGRALRMNPGEHMAVFASPGFRTLRTPVFVTEGERLEPHDVHLQAVMPKVASSEPMEPELLDTNASPPAAPARSRNWTWPIAAGALGALGGASFAYFGVSAQNGERGLDRCTPACSRAQVDAVKDDYLWANVSLGVGITALVAAGVLLVFGEEAPLTPASATGSAEPLGAWSTSF